ncbi:MAG: type II toxin-antitoxin system Phd/YefM family antitoxin [Candidatus Omnitrophota bacterium]
MRFVTVRDLRGRSAEVWKQLAKFREMVLTLNGKPIAIISTTSEELLEENLSTIRRARALAAVQAIHAESVRKGLDKMTMDEIDAVIQDVRRTRSK